MKKMIIGASLAVAASLVAFAPAFAAASLTSGSIGQRANDGTTFGVAVCNNGDTAQTASVPVSVAGNSVLVTAHSDSPIAPGACAYTYLAYSSFNMIGGQTYSLQIAVNGSAPSIYSVTVPGSVLGASTSATTPDQTNINLMATEVILLKQLIALLQAKLAL